MRRDHHSDVTGGPFNSIRWAILSFHREPTVNVILIVCAVTAVTIAAAMFASCTLAGDSDDDLEIASTGNAPHPTRERKPKCGIKSTRKWPKRSSRT